MIERKMSESRWDGVRPSAYRRMSVMFEGSPAEASLMTLSADAPVYAGRGAHRLRIIDDGYLWLQLAPKDGFWWLTAMYDDRARLVQFYFDITTGNRTGCGECSFEDIYVDVVITPGSSARIVDEDELRDACAAGDIGQEDAERALENARTVARKYENCAELEKFCSELLQKLIK